MVEKALLEMRALFYLFYPRVAFSLVFFLFSYYIFCNLFLRECFFMTDSKKFAVVLSGCGVFDGSEIHEAVSLLTAIDKASCSYQCFAPNSWQAKTIDHFTGQASAVAGDDDNRNVLAESARIARGNILPLSQFNPLNFDVLAFPGGMGAALNLSNFAEKGPLCDIHKEVEQAISGSYNNHLIIAAMCIAPVLLARVLGKYHVKITLGNDKNLAQGIQKTGAIHENHDVLGVCLDEKNRVVTTPAYMLAKRISDVAIGAENLVRACLNLD